MIAATAGPFPLSTPLGSLALEDDVVHVWCMASGHPLQHHQLDCLRGSLLPSEREREARFRFARDRQTFLLTRALVRNALSAYTGIAARELRFRANAHGKPELANVSVAGSISFNLSHTDGLIALGIAGSGAIGIDVERVCVRSASLDIAERFFAPEEVAALRAIPVAELPTAFFRHWTLKESYLKAHGVGLSVPLDAFSFRLNALDGPIELHAAPGDQASRWKLWQLSSGTHLLAVCAEQHPESRRRLLIRGVRPDWQCSGAGMELIGESGHE
ncbi:4'-phosphopantetheinyl transferase family protein [Cognatiluteimonas telluris]|jgi:4'-phosphopantetheinyl transferase|uniref:4'-phosphopantetheinyl transferase family protein n=1 Tax=Cognatiluteimonas telluris TaxID=1104775 RepID=UPI0014075E01|nr:4'-phosphopantetheinyl transferase superfamily protein [Lysobacter telluris]